MKILCLKYYKEIKHVKAGKYCVWDFTWRLTSAGKTYFQEGGGDDLKKKYISEDFFQGLPKDIMLKK